MTIAFRKHLEQAKRVYKVLRRKELCNTSNDAENHPTTSSPRNIAWQITSESQQPHTSNAFLTESSSKSFLGSETSTVNVTPEAAFKLPSSSSESDDETEKNADPETAYRSGDFEKSQPATSRKVKIPDKKEAMTKQQITSFNNIIGDVAKNLKNIQGELKTETENLRRNAARGQKRLAEVPKISHKFHEMIGKYESRLAEERRNFIESYKGICRDFNLEEATPMQKDACPEESGRCAEKVQKSPRNNTRDSSTSDYDERASKPNKSKNGISVDEDQERKLNETERSVILYSDSSTDVPEDRPVKRRKTGELSSSSIRTMNMDDEETDEPTVCSSNLRPKQSKDGTMPEAQKNKEIVPEVFNISFNNGGEFVIENMNDGSVLEVDKSEHLDSSTYYMLQEAQGETSLEDIEVESNLEETAEPELNRSLLFNNHYLNDEKLRKTCAVELKNCNRRRCEELNRSILFNSLYYLSDEKLRKTCAVELKNCNRRRCEEVNRSILFNDEKLRKTCVVELKSILPL